MLLLVLGLAVFIGAHLFTRARGVRAGLIARLGEGPYKGLYSLVSLIGLVLIVLGWRTAPYVELWSPPVWTRHLAPLLVWPAFVLIFSAHLPGHIRAKAKHPMLAGLKLWATAHLIANGDLASVILFGSLLAYGVVARIALKRDERAHGAPARPASWQNDVIAAVIGTAAFLLFGAFLHPLLIGKPAFGM
ncbi:NnrU family protein [Chelatococcus sambhunathii]|uniref:NnrU family protein n=1 Tax=Chelatococcus sambhunathii TaxID=363953 RepID=A0ABU1DAC6_9HYPH|nr:NnrU family protein [Chelatococcus sambhunathii]MDR4305073.1 NnrU family protein [Chelatococcus sambhunathii]